MSFILNIDTAVQTASICLAQSGEPKALKVNPVQQDSASWLQAAIKALIEEHNIRFAQLSAIAITAGPGSYTGLRVGMATAKGLCYALHIPLITINTLKVMAFSALGEPTELFCPMIDARRMEVFTAVYDKQLNENLKTHNLILQADSFKELLERYMISFLGNGSYKFQTIISHPNARFLHIDTNAGHLAKLSWSYYERKEFTDVAYSEPFYGKEFYTIHFKKKL